MQLVSQTSHSSVVCLVMKVIAARNPLGGNNPRGCQWAGVRISAPSLRQKHRLERKFRKVQSFHSILLHALEQDIESIKFFNQYFEQSLLCLEHCESASIRSKSWSFKKNVKTKEGACRICCCAEVFVSGSYYLYLLC